MNFVVQNYYQEIGSQTQKAIFKCISITYVTWYMFVYVAFICVCLKHFFESANKIASQLVFY